MTPAATPLEARIKTHALSLGFVACGITDLRPSTRAAWLDEWLARGYAGTMRYLHRQAKKRKDPRIIVPEAKSVVMVLDNYYSATESPPSAPKVAKYARGADYHTVTVKRLEQLADFLRQNGAQTTRPYADTGPVPERELAQRAGLGWIGKNTMLIRPGTGSYFFIGSVFTDLPLNADLPLETDHCGSCRACLDACPTGALLDAGVLDATRCISYLTIEQRGPIPDELASRLDGWVFGCDVCNDVCPWNRRFATASDVREFQPAGRLDGADAEFFERMDDEEFNRRFGDTPFARAGLDGMRRNFRAAFGRPGQLSAAPRRRR